LKKKDEKKKRKNKTTQNVSPPLKEDLTAANRDYSTLKTRGEAVRRVLRERVRRRNGSMRNTCGRHDDHEAWTRRGKGNLPARGIAGGTKISRPEVRLQLTTEIKQQTSNNLTTALKGENGYQNKDTQGGQRRPEFLRRRKKDANANDKPTNK